MLYRTWLQVKAGGSPAVAFLDIINVKDFSNWEDSFYFHSSDRTASPNDLFTDPFIPICHTSQYQPLILLRIYFVDAL